MLAGIVFWISLVALVWVYVGYPVDGRAPRPRSPRPSPSARTRRPTLTIAIAVHDEADHIADRIEDALAQADSGARIEEVLVGSDGSTDETEAIVAAMARAGPAGPAAVARRAAARRATQAALFAAARGDVVVLTDAETRFAPGCLAALAEALRDPRVGCATGRLEWRDERRHGDVDPGGPVLALRAAGPRAREPGRAADRGDGRAPGGPPGRATGRCR